MTRPSRIVRSPWLPVCFVTAVVLVAAPVRAQEYFPRFDFHMDGHYVVSDDPRFEWIFDFGGDVDIVRGDVARFVFVANYEAIAGTQFRRFDVNQGNYLLDGVLSFRAGPVEVGPVWHHMSRHLSDRPKRFSVDWNQISVRVRAEHARGPVDAVWHVDARKTVKKAFVDYDWELEGVGDVRRRLSPRVWLFAEGAGRVVGVDGSRDRGTQVEGRLAVGARFQDQGPAVELFAQGERRLDPYPVEFGTASWFLAGLRVLSR